MCLSVLVYACDDLCVYWLTHDCRCAQGIDSEFKNLMKEAVNTPNVVEVRRRACCQLNHHRLPSPMTLLSTLAPIEAMRSTVMPPSDPHSPYPLIKPLQACSVENRLEDLKSMLQRLELCQKSLNEYLVSRNASYTTLSRKLEHA